MSYFIDTPPTDKALKVMEINENNSKEPIAKPAKRNFVLKECSLKGKKKGTSKVTVIGLSWYNYQKKIPFLKKSLVSVT